MLARHLRPRLLLRPYRTTATRAFTVSTPRHSSIPTVNTLEDSARLAKEKWGHYLPHNVLATEELEVYVRLYGEPIRMLSAEEAAAMEADETAEALAEPTEPEGLLLLDSTGEPIPLEEEELSPEEEALQEAELVKEEELSPEEEALQEAELMREEDAAENEEMGREEEEEEMYEEEEAEDVEAYDRPVRPKAISPELRATLEAAGVSIIEHTQAELEALENGEELDDDLGPDFASYRTHPLTKLGQFGTRPGTVQMPESIVRPTMELLRDVVNKHIDEAAEKILGGPKHPKSGLMHGRADHKYKGIGMDTGDMRMSDTESNVHIAAVLPGMYAQTLGALTEMRKRLGAEWVMGGEGEEGVKRVLDVGTGGAGILAWREVLEAEKALRKEEEEEKERTKVEEGAEAAAAKEEAAEEEKVAEPAPTPEEEEAQKQRATVVIGSNSLRFRMSKFLDNTTFIKRLPDLPSASAPRKTYDLILATNTLHLITEPFKQRQHLDSLLALLNPNGGVLLLLEKGTPHGFECIATARESLLTLETPPLIIAPCTNSAPTCPMFIDGPSQHPRRDYCTFPQRYERPGYLQRILNATARNHDDLSYSYVAVRAGRTRNPAPSIDPAAFTTSTTPNQSPYPLAALRDHAYTLPRAVFRPIKRRGHVIIDVCTPSAQIERWTVPKSFGKHAYHDARKVQWGDIWALGAKSQVARNLKLGNERRARGGIKMKQETVLDVEAEDVKVREREVDIKGGKKRNPGKRERERRAQRTEARKAKWAMKEGLEGVEKLLEKKFGK